MLVRSFRISLLIVFVIGSYLTLASCKSGGASGVSGIDASRVLGNTYSEFLPKNCSINSEDVGEVQLYKNDEQSTLPYMILPKECDDPTNLRNLEPNKNTKPITLTSVSKNATYYSGYDEKTKRKYTEPANWCFADKNYVPDTKYESFNSSLGAAYDENEFCTGIHKFQKII